MAHMIRKSQINILSNGEKHIKHYPNKFRTNIPVKTPDLNFPCAHGKTMLVVWLRKKEEVDV